MASQNCTEAATRTGWDALAPKQHKALLLLVDDELSDEQIARQCGVTRRTLSNWKLNSDFDGAYHAAIAEYSARARSRKYALMFRRVDALNRKIALLDQVFAERGADPAMAGIPGGKTGLVVRQLKMIGTGHNAEVVEEYAIDTGGLKIWQSLLDTVRDEMGQKTERVELEVTKLVREYIGVNPDVI